MGRGKETSLPSDVPNDLPNDLSNELLLPPCLGEKKRDGMILTENPNLAMWCNAQQDSCNTLCGSVLINDCTPVSPPAAPSFRHS